MPSVFPAIPLALCAGFGQSFSCPFPFVSRYTCRSAAETALAAPAKQTAITHAHRNGCNKGKPHLCSTHSSRIRKKNAATDVPKDKDAAQPDKAGAS